MVRGRHLVAVHICCLGWAVLLLLAGSPLGVSAQAAVAKPVATPEQVYLLVRSDDAGMRHSVNMALQRLVETGLPVSVSPMLDMNTDQPRPDMSKHRQGELDAPISQRFSGALTARSVVLTTYRELIAKQGLRAMRRPAG